MFDYEFTVRRCDAGSFIRTAEQASGRAPWQRFTENRPTSQLQRVQATPRQTEWSARSSTSQWFTTVRMTADFVRGR